MRQLAVTQCSNEPVYWLTEFVLSLKCLCGSKLPLWIAITVCLWREGVWPNTVRSLLPLHWDTEMAAGKGSVREDTTKQQEGLCSFREEVLLKRRWYSMSSWKTVLFGSVFSTKTNLNIVMPGPLNKSCLRFYDFYVFLFWDLQYLGLRINFFSLYFAFHCRKLLITICSLINQAKFVCIMLFTIHIVLKQLYRKLWLLELGNNTNYILQW